jgi:hypothetical protein
MIRNLKADKCYVNKTLGRYMKVQSIERVPCTTQFVALCSCDGCREFFQYYWNVLVPPRRRVFYDKDQNPVEFLRDTNSNFNLYVNKDQQ